MRGTAAKRATDEPRTNLPPLRTLIGRGDELGEIAALLDGGERVVTLVGPPGIGKTTLALHAAATRVAGVPGGVWMVDLTAARDAQDIAAAAGKVLGVPSEPARIGLALAARGPSLVILDNVEQIVDAAAGTLAAWLRTTPATQWLVTSRELLRIGGERSYEVAPLPAGRDAVHLLVERAAGYRRRPEDEPWLEKIVAELEGIPLAIELAATRLALLGPQKLLERLPRLDLLSPGRRDASARQATLRAAIDWSWSLLRDAEREVLAQCAVFRGGFDAAAVERVVQLAEPDAGAALDLLGALKDKSLLRAEEAVGLAGEVRLRLYESIREYATEKLAASGGEPQARARHALHFAEAGATWAAAVHGPTGVAAHRRLATERENLLAALATATETDPATVPRLLLALDPLLSRGPSDRHLVLLDRALSSPAAVASSRARILEARARAHLRRGAQADALADLDEATLLAAGDAPLEAALFLDRADAHQARGELDEARSHLERAAHLADAARDRVLGARIARSLGILHHSRGQLPEAWDAYERAMTTFRALGDRASEASLWQDYGSLRLQQGRLDEARAHYEQALDIAREVGDARVIGLILGNLGILEQEHAQASLDAADARFSEALSIFARLGERPFEGHLLGYLAALRFEQALVAGEGRTALLEESRRRHEDALALLREVGDRRLEGLFLASRGAVDASLGRLEAAEEAFAAAAERLGDLGDPGLLATLELHRGQLDAARGDFDGARRRLDQLEGDPSRAPLIRASDDLRFALRTLHRAVVARALVIGPEGAWFRAPGGEQVDLSTREALRHIVAAFARRRLDAPGTPLSLDEIRAEGWPDERMLPEAAQNRVGVALTSLRKLGLRDVLVREGEGYLFDPSVPMVCQP